MVNIIDITSEQAWNFLIANKKALILDVRTNSEWQNVGKPKLPAGKLLLISWRISPTMSLNLDFMKLINDEAIPEDNPILVICKSGVRSSEASKHLMINGYKFCMNISDGFEGSSAGLGWKYSNLPWSI